MVRSPLTAARATFALKAGEWFRRGRLLMVSPVHGDYRRHQAEIPLIALSKFPRPALASISEDTAGSPSPSQSLPLWQEPIPRFKLGAKHILSRIRIVL